MAESLCTIMDLIMFIVTLSCIIVIACSLAVVELSDSFNLQMLTAFFDLAVLIGVTFAYYYASEWITSDLLQIGDIFYDSAWYRLPARQQRLVRLSIIRGQSVLRLRGLGFVECSLPVFASVSSTLNWPSFAL